MTYQEAKLFFKEYANKRALLSAVSGNLSIIQREIIITVDIDGLSLQEASDKLNISLPSLKRKRDKAFTVMGKLIEEYNINK